MSASILAVRACRTARCHLVDVGSAETVDHPPGQLLLRSSHVRTASRSCEQPTGVTPGKEYPAIARLARAIQGRPAGGP